MTQYIPALRFAWLTPVYDLVRAQKTADDDVALRFDQGLATALPYDDDSFDCVLSNLMLHHLATEDKGHALREAMQSLILKGASDDKRSRVRHGRRSQSGRWPVRLPGADVLLLLGWLQEGVRQGAGQICR
jgi:hypothetical protein